MMRRITKSSPFFFPFSEGTTKCLFQNLMIPATNGYPVHFCVGSNFGGGRALPMFFIDNYDYLCNLWGVKNEDCLFVYINPDDLESGGKQKYLKLIYQELGGKRPSTYYSGLVKDIRKEIENSSKKVVIFFRAFNFLDFADSYLWGSIRSIISGLDNVGVVFVSYSGGLDINSERYSRVSDLLGQNIVALKKLSREDENYLIDRWGYMFEKEFSDNERTAISKISKGSPMLIKMCCVSLASTEIKDPFEFLKSNDAIRNSINARKIVFNDTGITVGNSNVTYLFSDNETRVLEKFIKKENEILTKDEIATLLWKSRVLEKYSEPAISQLIRRLRDKLYLMDVPREIIQTAHGKGYILRQ